MTQTITPGRYRGLKTTSLADADVFGIIAFDQRGNYVTMLPEGTPFDTLVQIKAETVSLLARDASAILLDPLYGLAPAMQMSGHSGLILALEKSGYTGDSTYRKIDFIDGWTPQKIRTMGASAAKILVYYNPQAEALADELDSLLKRVISECHSWDLPVFLEPIAYSVDASIKKESAAFAEQRADIVVETARRLSQTGADVLKMEFPLDLKINADHNEWRKQCQRLSDVSSVPWVLLSAGVDYEEYEPQVLIACESGASGFLAGRAVWKEGIAMTSADRKTFLEETATYRLRRLIDIALQKARPWTDFYSAPAAVENWFEKY